MLYQYIPLSKLENLTLVKATEKVLYSHKGEVIPRHPDVRQTSHGMHSCHTQRWAIHITRGEHALFFKWHDGFRAFVTFTIRPTVLERTQSSWGRTDTQRNVLSGLTRKRQLRSKIWWFTEFCNSHYVSHFAAFFIDTRAKISVAKSCDIKFYF